MAESMSAEEVAFQHRSGLMPFHEAFDILRKRYEIPEEVALLMLFPPLADDGSETIG